jgi:mono/diheme cytochrome c family protein
MIVATTQQNLAVAFVVALVVGWAIFLLLSVKKSGEAPGDEAATAPNRRPYFDDDALEGPRLERAQKWALAMLVVVVIGLPLYWVDEPSRQAGAAVGFDKRAAARGFVLWQPTTSDVPEGNIGHFGCGGCHGNKGEGGVTTFALTAADGSSRQVTWKAPALDTVLLRFTEDEVNTIITYGRANTPMPAWGVAGGGPMNEQQVTDIIEYLKSLQLSAKEAREAAAAVGTDGATLFDQFCSRCHTKGWSYGESEAPGSGAFAPSLLDGVTLRQFPDILKHIEFITLGSEYQKAYGARGVGTGRMPGFGQMLSEAQIRAIVEYERSL